MPRALSRRERTPDPFDAFDRLDHWFSNWAPMVVGRRAPDFPFEEAARMVRVEEFKEDGEMVIRAELPGIDPEKDLELTVSGGMLDIEAERREEEKSEKRGYVRRELRYGSFHRSLPLPEGVAESDITATYNDGMLEIRIPAPKTPQPKRISIKH